eukprot:13761826-Ditylum_brightwellii.AAC.1
MNSDCHQSMDMLIIKLEDQVFEVRCADKTKESLTEQMNQIEDERSVYQTISIFYEMIKALNTSLNTIK